MDRQIWLQIRRAVISAQRRVPRIGRRTVYSDSLIVKLFIWSAWHDRPLCWAMDRLHFNSLFHPSGPLPSYSQFCRRLKSPRVRAMLQCVHAQLAGRFDPREIAFLDGKALPVSESSRDKDARVGRGNGRFSRGYKLHAWATQHQRIGCFSVTPLNAGEPVVAREQLAGQLPRHALTLADGNYDSNLLYAAMDAHGHRLLTPLRGRLGRRDRRHISPARRRAIELWRNNPETAAALLSQRGTVERAFANLSNFGGGLTHLPPWVRTLPRVTLWVTAKLIIYHARANVRTAARIA
jgi:hypothetical protein